MKRWFIARMGDYDGDGARVPATNKYPCNTRIWSIGSRPWCLGQLAVADLTAIGSDSDVRILPEATLDLTWGSIATGIRNQALNAMQAAGFTTNGISTSMSVRDVLLYIVRQIQPAIDSVESGDVPDIEQ